MKKKPIVFVILLIVLAALAATYYFVASKPEQEEETEEKKEYYITEEKHIDLIDTINVVSDGKNYVMRGIHSDTEESEWVLDGYEDVKFDPDNMRSVPLSFNHMPAEDIVEGEKSDLSEYGLKPALVTATVNYTDGTKLVLYIGSKAVDGENYYAMVEGDDNIYLLNSLYKDRIDIDLNYLVDKKSATIDPNRVMYIDIQRQGKEEIEIEYVENTNNTDKMSQNLSEYGMQTLTMRKPFDGTMVYPVNIQSTILENTSFLKAEELVDLKPADLSKYGLDNPQMIIKLKDMENSLEIKVGDSCDENNYYCLIDDKISVFKILKSSVEPFTNADVMDFMEKFVSLNYRVDLSGITIRNNDMVYEVSFSEASTQQTTQGTTTQQGTEDKKNTKDTRIPYINGKEIDDAEFTDFYELLAGITFDSVISDAGSYSNPVITITYKNLDGTENKVDFYDYNENFYITDIEGEYAKAVHKKTVALMLTKLEELV